MIQRNEAFGHVPWHLMRPGETILIERGYDNAPNYIRRKTGGAAKFATTTKDAPEGKRWLMRLE